MNPDWFNPRKENAYFPLPLIALFIFNIVMFLKIVRSVGRLTRFVLFYSVWCGAVGIIWYSESAMLRYAKQGIDPDRSERRSQVYGGLSLAVPVAGIYLAYQAALFLETLW